MKFVYVEDERSVQQQTAMSLRYERHEVDVFDNTVDAINHIRENEPDVLLCDFRLEGSPDGLVLATHVRRMYPSCTIVMVSHYAGKAEFERAFRLGVDDFVSRPVPLPVLLDRIWGAVQRRRALVAPPAPEVLTSGPLVLDVKAHTALLDGEPLPLTPSEFLLLQHLVSHPGQLVSFPDLGAHLWGERLDRKSARRRLKPHIINLRAKLEERMARPAIVSVWGYGYRWELDESARPDGG